MFILSQRVKVLFIFILSIYMQADLDFLIAVNCNFARNCHRLDVIRVFLLTGNDVTAISRLGGIVRWDLTSDSERPTPISH